MWVEDNPTPVSVALVLLGIVAGVAALVVDEPTGSERSPDWFAYVLVVAVAVPVFWRRTRPLVALPLSSLATVIYWIMDYPASVDPVLWVMFYSATRHGGADRRRVWRVVGACLLLVELVALAGVLSPVEDLPPAALLGILILFGTSAVAGEALFQRSQHIEELEKRAAMLEADLESKAALATVEERGRIAREMHDIIAHGMSTVVVQAQAGQRVVDSDPAKAREVLNTIEHIGRDSVDEMRRMLGVLRSEGEGEAELRPQPGLGDLVGLIAHAEQAGVEVDLKVSGERRPLPPGLELTGYRVVQEALTNVIRHAGRPVKADVGIHHGEHAVEILVSDDGLGAAVSRESAGSGHGLLGMGERVEIYNGELSAGTKPGGGFEIAVSLPVGEQVNA